MCLPRKHRTKKREEEAKQAEDVLKWRLSLEEAAERELRSELAGLEQQAIQAANRQPTAPPQRTAELARLEDSAREQKELAAAASRAAAAP